LTQKRQTNKNINQSILVILHFGRLSGKLTFWQVDILEVDHFSKYNFFLQFILKMEGLKNCGSFIRPSVDAIKLFFSLSPMLLQNKLEGLSG
jgi:hypothetical protein